MKYTKTELLPFSFCNQEANLSLLGASKIVQDACSSTLAILGSSNLILKQKYNSMWVIAKNRMQFFDTIGWNEEITIESYVSKISKITLLIDTYIKDKAGEIIVCSKLEICPVDLQTRKLRRIESVGIALDTSVEPPLLEYDFTPFTITDLKKIAEINIPSTSIDFSKHTNNTEYIRHIMNTYSVQALTSHKIVDFEIHYTKESKENELLGIYKKQIENTDHFILQKDIDIIIKAKLTYTKA